MIMITIMIDKYRRLSQLILILISDMLVVGTRIKQSSNKKLFNRSFLTISKNLLCFIVVYCPFRSHIIYEIFTWLSSNLPNFLSHSQLQVDFIPTTATVKFNCYNTIFLRLVLRTQSRFLLDNEEFSFVVFVFNAFPAMWESNGEQQYSL